MLTSFVLPYSRATHHRTGYLPRVRPNFIIAGVNKAGTTSLWSYLAQHPQVGPSAIKETCHFLPLRYEGETLPPITDYEALFPAKQTSQLVRMESTPGYFYGGQPLAQGIDHACPDVKILIILREPVSRLISFYRFQQSQLHLPQDLAIEQYLQACQALSDRDLRQRKNNPYFGYHGGLYTEPLKAWQAVFGDRLRVAFFDDLKANPREVVRQTCHWLGIDEAFAETFDTQATNQTRGFKHAGVQKLALTINHHGERFWRKHPAIKRVLKNCYGKLNSRSIQSPIDESLLSTLSKQYTTANKDLQHLLNGYTFGTKIGSIPTWADT